MILAAMLMLRKLLKKQTPAETKVLPNGILDVGSERFRSLCAVHESGIYNVATGNNFTEDYVVERNALIKQRLLPEHSITQERYLPVDEIAKLYGRTGGSEAVADVQPTTTPASEKLLHLVEHAARARASDFEIKQGEHKTVIRVKVAGKWRSFGEPWTADEGKKALTFAFNAADGGSGHTSMQKLQLQSFSINHQVGFPLPENVIKLRGQKGYHESATSIGQDMVFRLFYSDDAADTGTLEDLGFDDDIYHALQRERETLEGCVFIGGITGDGKSTTLIRSIDRIVKDTDGEISIVTVEDPVEYVSDADCVKQIPVKSSGDSEERKAEYQKVLHHAVRINPDICIVSEIRDVHAAKEVMEFVASGHKAYTTIHVKTANKIPFRLISMGLPAAELAGGDNITLLMKQSLVQVLCEDCKIPMDADKAAQIVAKYDLDRPSTLYKRNKSGCPSCTKQLSDLGRTSWAGYARLIAVGEFIEPDDTYFEYVRQQDEAGARKHWLKPMTQGGLGGITITQKIAKMVSRGLVDSEDAKRLGLKPVLKIRVAI